MTGALAAVAAVRTVQAGIVYADPDFVTGTQSGSSPGVVSDPTTAFPAGTTYVWSFESGDAMSANSPTSRTTTFSAAVMQGSSKSAIFRLDTPLGFNFVSVLLEHI